MTGDEQTPPTVAPAQRAKPGVGQLTMRPVEVRLYRAQLVPPPRCYLEWGLGGSTAEALRAGAGLVVSVEGDGAWIAAARDDAAVAAAEATGRLRLVHADIGPTGKWGMPVDRGTRARWPGYAAAPWPVLDAAGAWPDLVLVDGRFRVACCLSMARECLARPDRPPPRLMLHDFNDQRPHYEPMRLAWEEVGAAASLRVFRLRAGIDPAALAAGIAAHDQDPR
ncbi:hypothetical protein [Roseomonas fluvialis]|uniref:Class I SAM-dependent methyltransferase n=1 Tax=Roseomonas fluvialis TaxID=1750527 RepID=A0ABN6P5S9_9PROT|nr:hypothetical protein [Roseomonas fluvialis]BDG73313.1 hypothetical protein Rmf_32420 [Roseomonas fluvialis]